MIHLVFSSVVKRLSRILDMDESAVQLCPGLPVFQFRGETVITYPSHGWVGSSTLPGTTNGYVSPFGDFFVSDNHS